MYSVTVFTHCVCGWSNEQLLLITKLMSLVLETMMKTTIDKQKSVGSHKRFCNWSYFKRMATTLSPYLPIWAVGAGQILSVTGNKETWGEVLLSRLVTKRVQYRIFGILATENASFVWIFRHISSRLIWNNLTQYKTVAMTHVARNNPHSVERTIDWAIFYLKQCNYIVQRIKL